jgi:HD superfamily phosphodiesterase
VSDDYPLAMLEHRISVLRERLTAASRKSAELSGEQRAVHAVRVADLGRELAELENERDVLAADSR